MNASRFLEIAACALVSTAVGCQHHVDLRPTALEAPLTWKTPDAARPFNEIGADSLKDWALFDDTQLLQLLESALSDNLDIAIALERLKESRSQTRALEASLIPDVSTRPSYDNTRLSQNNRQISQFARGAPGAIDLQTSQLRLPIDLAYEIDVFGRVREAIDAATALDDAAAYDVQALKNTIAAEIATQYFQLRGIDAELDTLDQIRRVRRDSLDLLKSRVAAGLSAETQLQDTLGSIAELDADIHDLHGQRANLESAIGILCGRNFNEFELKSNPLFEKPPSIPVGLPSELLNRRPDILHAERAIAAAAAEVGVAQKDFLPSIRLTGSAGFESVSLSELLSFDSRFWSIGPDLSIPLDIGGRLKAKLQAAQSRWEQAQLAYKASALTAFQETHASLQRLQNARETHAALTRNQQTAEKSATFTRSKYLQGLESEIDLLRAQSAALQEQRKTRRALTALYTNSAQLFKALGGGWEAYGQAPD